MNSNSKAYIFIGRSGCGKGTQANLFIQHLCEHDHLCHTVHVESGAILREYVKSEGYAQKLCKDILDKGGLMPEFAIVGLWSNYLLNNIKEGDNVVFDGTPRKLHEAIILDSSRGFFNWGKPVIVYLNVSREWSKARLVARKREDDTDQDIENRLNWFETEVMPTINYYRENPNYIFLDINGEQAIEEVQREIMTKIGIN
ncbi:MAG: nucleoside monophosphate kinase [bacterium]